MLETVRDRNAVVRTSAKIFYLHEWYCAQYMTVMQLNIQLQMTKADLEKIELFGCNRHNVVWSFFEEGLLKTD